MRLPDLPAVFRWTHEPFGPALRCTPLEAIAPHLFTTRQSEVSSAAQGVAAALGAERTATVRQVHGRNVVVVGSGRGVAGPDSPGPPEADVLVSSDRRVAIAVRAADCVPLLIGDPATGAVAAVHAGWRGTAAGAAAAAVGAMMREFGTEPRDAIAAIGPSIGPCCYEVGPELVDAFASAGHGRALIDRWFAAQPVPAGRERSALRLDTWTANRDQLVFAGLDPRNVHTAGLCTACHPTLLPSFRRERDLAGRILGAIRARPPF